MEPGGPRIVLGTGMSFHPAGEESVTRSPEKCINRNHRNFYQTKIFANLKVTKFDFNFKVELMERLCD